MWEKKDTFKERYTKDRIKLALELITWGYRKLNKRFKFLIYFSAVMNIIPTLLGLYSTWLNKNLINAVISGDAKMFYRAIIISISITIFNLIWDATYGYYISKEKTAMYIYFKEVFYHIILDKEYGAMENLRLGEVLRRLQGDIPALCGQIYSFPSFFINLIIQIIGTGYLIWTTFPEVGFLAIPFIIVSGLVNRFIAKHKQKYSKKLWEMNSKESSTIIEHLNNLLLFHTLGKEDASFDQISKAMNDTRDTELEVVRVDIGYARITTIISSVMSIGLMFFLLRLVLLRRLEFGTYTMLYSLVGQLRGQAGAITGIIPTLYELTLTAERVNEIDKSPNDLTREKVSFEKADAFYEDDFKAIVMDDVSFSYPDSGVKVLDHFNLSINKGEFVAITGESGCGKSTTQKLMLGLYKPNAGNLYLIKNNGEKEVLDSAWRSLFAYVPQRNLLLYGTIKEAIDFGDKSDNEDDYYEALKIACADEFVRKLPNGLDSQLKENGMGLSEGQIQRLAIARAIYTKRPILLLDECTSSLDSKTERQLLINLRAMTNKTVIIVTHRLKALEYCDREIPFGKEL